MKILIVDDHPLFLVGLRQVFADSPEPIEAVEAHDHANALAIIASSHDIDWICLDLQMPSGDGFSFIRTLTEQGCKIPVAILSANEQAEMVDRALQSGARAYLSKSMSKSELVEAFAAIRDRGRYISRGLREGLKHYQAGNAGHRAATPNLTKRQIEVLRRLALGDSNQAIANQLSIAESTVKGHVSTLFDLLEVENRAGCTRVAIRMGLID